jgi:hypothetical protein
LGHPNEISNTSHQKSSAINSINRIVTGCRGPSQGIIWNIPGFVRAILQLLQRLKVSLSTSAKVPRNILGLSRLSYPTCQIRSNLEQRKNRVPPPNENLQRPLGLGQGAPQTTPPVAASHIRHKKLPADHFCYSSAGCLQRLPLCVPVAKHALISGGGLWWIRNHVVEAGCKLSISHGCSLTFIYIV